MVKVAEMFETVKAVIADPAHWTQLAAARDADGRSISTDSPDAVCFCLWGAVVKSFPDKDDRSIVTTRLMDRCKEITGEGFIGFNDTHPHELVMAFIDHAIALERLR